MKAADRAIVRQFNKALDWDWELPDWDGCFSDQIFFLQDIQVPLDHELWPREPLRDDQFPFHAGTWFLLYMDLTATRHLTFTRLLLNYVT